MQGWNYIPAALKFGSPLLSSQVPISFAHHDIGLQYWERYWSGKRCLVQVRIAEIKRWVAEPESWTKAIICKYGQQAFVRYIYKGGLDPPRSFWYNLLKQLTRYIAEPFIESISFMCEEGEKVPLHPMGIRQSVSQESSGKQNQDTGDLFFMSTSLTRYPLQVLLMWILKSDISSSSSGWKSCPIWYWWHRQDLRQLKKLHLIECKYETCRFFRAIGCS